MPGASRIRPILKWPGGKFRLLDFLLPELPAGDRLVEPFVGSGAVFLNSDYPSYLLADCNADLIGFYQNLADAGETFASQCRRLFTPEANAALEYYRRRERFNALAPGAERYALFLYLNRHGYNGLIRYNAGGDFNVPFGRYLRPYFPEAEIKAFLEKTRTTQVTFAVLDFRDCFARIEHGDVVYCDPPYIPLSATANFTTYAGTTFGAAEQLDLAILAERAAARGATVVVSNHDAGEARNLYRSAACLRQAAVRRSISCNGRRRGLAQEILAVYPKRTAGGSRPTPEISGGRKGLSVPKSP